MVAAGEGGQNTTSVERAARVAATRPNPSNLLAEEEARRLSILRSLNVLNTPREKRFDTIVRATKDAFQAPIVVITLVEENHCWFKAETGIGGDTIPRELSICTLCVADKMPLVIENAIEDSRVSHLPMVAQAPEVRFYAGHPLVIQGAVMGTLCVLDFVPRSLSGDQRLILSSLAGWVCAELERDQIQAMATALEKSQARYLAVFQDSPQAVALFSTGGRYLEGNRLADQLWRGAGLADLSSAHCLGGEAMREGYRQVLKGAPAIVEAFSAIRNDGRPLSLQGSLRPLRVNGQLDGILVTLEDVSETVLASEEQTALRFQVIEQKAAASQADEGLRHFLSTLAHELRNPITGLLGYAEVLRENPKSLDAEMIAAIHSCSSTLAELVDDLLDLERLKQQRLSLRSEPFHLGALVESVVALHRAAADAKSIEVRACIGEGCEHVLGDEVRVRQILSNLVSNAIKYTSPKGTVGLGCRASSEGYLLEVSDTGVGMSEEALRHVFEPYFQVSGSAPDSKLGVGLGLNICKTLVDLMGGEVGASSRLGLGSRFWARLPLPACHRPEQTGETAGGKLLARVLVVDDNPINRRVLELQLGTRGASTSSVQNGQEALDLLEMQRFDVVLMDCQMPVLDGYQTTRAIKADPARYGHPWIVALTGASAEESEGRCREAGMDDFLSKPVRCDELHSKIAAIFATAPA